MEGYFKQPSNSSLSAGSTLSPSTQAQIPKAQIPKAQLPKAQLPAIGDKMLFISQPYGGFYFTDGTNVVGETDIVEVEVTAIKKSKITLE